MDEDDGEAASKIKAAIRRKRNVALRRSLERIAARKGLARPAKDGVIDLEPLAWEATNRRGALESVRQGGIPWPDTLIEVAHFGDESPLHLFKIAYGLTHEDAVSYMQESTERDQAAALLDGVMASGTFTPAEVARHLEDLRRFVGLLVELARDLMLELDAANPPSPPSTEPDVRE